MTPPRDMAEETGNHGDCLERCDWPDCAAPLAEETGNAVSLDLEAIKARCEAATAAPWWTENGGDGIYAYVPGGRPNGEGIAIAEYFGSRSSPANAEFIAHARQDIPLLVAEIERLRGRV